MSLDAPADTTAEAESTASASAALADTPTVRGALRRARTWIVLGAVLLVGALVVLIVQGGLRAPGPTLGADNAAPSGARALVQVLRAQGVEVTVANHLEAAIDAADGATVLLFDEHGLLDRASLRRLAGAADGLVVALPRFAALEALAPGVRLAGTAVGELDDPACEVRPAERAGELGHGQGLLTIDDVAEGDGWTGCFPDGDFGYALVIGPSDAGAELSLVPSTAVFANDTVDERGNAALALGLLGERERLVWYLPGPADAEPAGATAGELTPGWVSPVLVLLLVVGLAAAIWRGRRFGPLVIEDLPVEVPAGETAEGRARLYARGVSRLHALDQLRIGSVGRLTALLRLPRSAPLPEVIAATTAATGRDPLEVESLLVGAVPAGDRELVELADRLAALEQRVRDALGPQTSGPVTSGTEASDPASVRGPATSDPTTDHRGRRP
ncbi:DUF4350 domain-containing protein [Agromyces intestinalis]|uniref:DUF4350 domain-containing protein n=1 Tax=Agromyces intestinalis TaxID=2592652 RepID=A0A5C1YIK6_9MICO|nr:DUF4350 domain-containing protein [Agromyces intestinalis]QEO16044.1 DUF4350 domain-containing protein [Agromyces intestinalis]